MGSDNALRTKLERKNCGITEKIGDVLSIIPYKREITRRYKIIHNKTKQLSTHLLYIQHITLQYAILTLHYTVL
jgi:hypothetical protein